MHSDYPSKFDVQNANLHNLLPSNFDRNLEKLHNALIEAQSNTGNKKLAAIEKALKSFDELNFNMQRQMQSFREYVIFQCFEKFNQPKCLKCEKLDCPAIFLAACDLAIKCPR